MLLGLVPLLAEHHPFGWLRAALVLALAMTLAAIWRRLRGLGKVERMTCLLLFAGPSLLLSGLRMPAGDTLLAFPLVGLAAILIGLREHAAFLRLGRELGGDL
jgi:ABC-type Co2+ transport system permease subunit